MHVIRYYSSSFIVGMDSRYPAWLMIHTSALLPHQVMVFHWAAVVVEDGQGVVGLDQEVIVHPPARGHV